jgi:argininosuccinate lyase
MLQHTRANREVCQAAAQDPALLATDLADYLVRKKMPFRQAHHAVGALVAFAEKAGKPLDQLTLDEFQAVSPAFGPDALQIFDLNQALARRELPGAPGTKEVRRQVAQWKKALQRPA